MSEGRWARTSAEDGVSSVEYGVLAAAVGIVLVATGPALADVFRDLLRLITGGMGGG